MGWEEDSGSEDICEPVNGLGMSHCHQGETPEEQMTKGSAGRDCGQDGGAGFINPQQPRVSRPHPQRLLPRGPQTW